MQNLYTDLAKLLEEDERLFAEGRVLKNKVTELAIKLDRELLKILLQNKQIKEHFFVEVEEILVFDQDKFIKFVNNKEFLPNSFTIFKNRIGLIEGDEYLKDSGKVVLAWPYKDCVLEGGQDREDAKRNEIFYNEILAPDEIDRLFEPKVLTNFKKIDKTGEHKIDQITKQDNLLIKGNNLLALHSLKKKYRGEIKLIYIDPPYNTGNDGFNYNDSFNHSTWLTFMKNRLQIAKELLKDDGVIFVQCDDNEQAYLKILMDEIFNRTNYLNTISVKVKESSGASGGGEDKRLKKNIENILCYFNKNFDSFRIAYIEKELMEYIKDMKESDTSFKYTNVLVNIGGKKLYKNIKDGSGKDINIFKIENYVIKSINQLAKEENISSEDAYRKYYEKIFATTNAQTSIRTRVWNATDSESNFYSITYIPKSGKNKGKETELYFFGKQKVLLIWLKDTSIKKEGQIYKKTKVGTYWDGFSWINVQKEGSVELSNGKKPEELLERIIDMATEKGDLVLDYHLGSGTTCAVAHKMGRQYIGVEQLDYGDNDSVVRLKNVISGDQSGISKSVNWKGGGSFVYMELKQWNEKYVKAIQEAKTTKELLVVYKKMQQESFFRYEIGLSEFDQKQFSELALEDQKRVLLECLDKNHLYVNYSDIEDAMYKIPTEEKKINKQFYGN